MYASKQVQLGFLQNKPCTTVGLGDGAILAKTYQFPRKFLFCLICHMWGLEWRGPIYLLRTNTHVSRTFLCVNNLFNAY
jgi:hypothetical protein